MALINRVRVAWTGIPAGPGVSTFYFAAGTVPGGSLRTLFTDFQNHIPTGITIVFPTVGDQLESTTGVIAGSWTAGPTTEVAGLAAAAPYSAVSGMCIDWLTASVVGGRRPMGRTFFVPLATTVYQNNGTILDSFLTVARAAASTFVTAMGSNFVVYSRPNAALARPGAASPVVSSKVPDKAVVLRSRRD